MSKAYDKYQERKTNKIQAAGFNRSPSPELLEYQANSEILEKAGISPPSCDDVVVNRAEISGRQIGVSEKEVKGEKGLIEDFTDFEAVREVPNGLRAPNVYRGPVQVAYGGPENHGGHNVVYARRCEQKRAEKMVRKAEKQAAKLTKA